MKFTILPFPVSGGLYKKQNFSKIVVSGKERRLTLWINGYVNLADMYTILKSAIPTAVSSRAQLSKTCQKIGYAPSAEPRKICSRKSNRTNTQ